MEANNVQLKGDLDNAISKTILLRKDITSLNGKLNVSEENNKKINNWLDAANAKIELIEEEG